MNYLPINPLAYQIKPALGFALLEVLVALSLILGVWMSSVGVYQYLSLRNTQAESKRIALRKEFDAFEINILSRAADSTKNQISKGRHESSRVSGSNRAQHNTAHSHVKDKRRFSGKTN